MSGTVDAGHGGVFGAPLRILSAHRFGTTWVAAAMIAPAALVVFLFVAVPLVRALWMSLFGIVLTRPGVEPFVGLGNYTKQLSNPEFWDAIGRSVTFTASSTALELVLGLGLALLMHQRLRFRWLLRGLAILPWALPGVSNALMWRWVDHAQYGALNALLTQAGLTSSYTNFLGDPALAMPMVVIADVYKNTPLVALLLLAALQTVPRETVEAAQVDGASAFRVFRHITLPLITPVILVALVLRTIDAFKIFDTIWIMTRGGPANGTQTIGIYAYKTAYQSFDFGGGAALGYLIALLIVGLAAIYIRLLRRAPVG
jgi:multiple sugar transport system permease protein/N,N'-diacetylchitobiose transport system permease protein